MKLETAFELSAVLLAGSGFAGLVFTGELPLFLALLGSLALILSLARIAGYGQGWPLFHLSQRVWTGFMLMAFAGMLVDLFWISGDMLPAGTHFLIVLMAQKLFTLHHRKDFLHLYAISLMELLAAAALTTELWYAGVFAVYLLASIWTLLLYHLRSEAEEVQAAEATGALPVDPSRKPGSITGRFFWRTNTIAVSAFCLTLLIFFVTPRIGVGFFQKGRVELIRTTGFSEKVDLGMVGSVKLDDTVVMRVEFPDQKGPLTERVYFRGASYDAYDGKSWSKTLNRRRPLVRTLDGEFLAIDATGLESAGVLRQDILVEALDTPLLFGASFVGSVKGAFPLVHIDGMGDVSLPYPPSSRFQYSVRSLLPSLSSEDRAKTLPASPDAIRERFLQLPPTSPRVAELARQVTRTATSPYEMVTALEQHLQQNYTYSLDIGLMPGLSPVEDFLFSRKTGYCDHYATAMVMLLRTLGIPSRLATGFAQGEWNDVGNYYTVRQRDAHAWVEVYFPRSGWLTFDPTPAVIITPSNPVLARVSKVIDSVRLKWDRFVIRYSFRDQMTMAQNVRDRTDAVRTRVTGEFAALLRWSAEVRKQIMEVVQNSSWLMAAMTGAGILLLGWLLFRHKLLSRGWGFSRRDTQIGHQLAAIQLYTDMLALLKGRGFGKSPGATPLEFAGRIAHEWSRVGPPVAMLTDLYCRVRFGHTPLSAEDAQTAQTHLASLRIADH